MWLKATVVVLAVLCVGVLGWNPWERISPTPHTRVASPSHPVTTGPSEPSTTTASPQLAPLGDGVTVRGRQLVDAAGSPVRLLGVVASGTQSACVAGHGISTAPLDGAEAQAMVSWHLDAVRIPLNEDCWLGINGVKPAYSGVNYQNAIEQWVAALNNAGLVAILDLEFSAPGAYLANGEWPMPDEDHSPTFWSQVAAKFASTPGVIFDLFNEPYLGVTHPTTADWSCWLNGCTNTTPVATRTSKDMLVAYQTAGMQQLVDVVRATGARQPIMLGGLNWSGDPCGWRAGQVPAACPEVTYLPSDPLHQLIVDFHTYLPNSACQTLACWDALAAGIGNAGLPIVTGEFGEKDCSAAFMESYMDWADQHGISYLAWTWSVNDSEPCVVDDGRSNHYLLGNWNGTPTTMSPDGQAFKTHVEAVYEEQVASAGS